MAQYLGTVKLGGFYNNGAILKRPTRPWRNDTTPSGASAAGDIPSMSGSMANYSFGDTPSADANKLQWVKIKDGESPVKGEGKLFIIDGGISKAYQKQTGIAGYTFIFNSRFMALAEHKPYSPLQEDGSQVFHTPVLRPVKTLEKRMLVRDTDQGEELQQEVEELKELVKAYRNGDLKEQ